MENVKRLTNRQVLEIAQAVNEKYKIQSYGSWYSIADRKTGERSENGGDYNFVGYNMNTLIETKYLEIIGENGLYFGWMTNGVAVTNERKAYKWKIVRRVVELLSGFKHRSESIAA